jgi:hypothetical protein
MSIPRPISILIVFLMSIVVWIALLAIAARTGTPARFLLTENCLRPTFEVARLAFDSERQARTDYVIVGLPEFIERMATRLPETKTHTAVALPGLSLPQLSAAVDLFGHKKPTAFILQNAPHLWTDLLVAVEKPDTRAWKLHTRSYGGFRWAYAALENLAVLKRIATAPCQPREANPELPNRFLWASFLPEPMFSERRGEFRAAPANQANTVWVFDPAWIPADTMDDTRHALIEFCATARQVPGLGQFVAIDEFAIK